MKNQTRVWITAYLHGRKYVYVDSTVIYFPDYNSYYMMLSAYICKGYTAAQISRYSVLLILENEYREYTDIRRVYLIRCSR